MDDAEKTLALERLSMDIFTIRSEIYDVIFPHAIVKFTAQKDPVSAMEIDWLNTSVS